MTRERERNGVEVAPINDQIRSRNCGKFLPIDEGRGTDRSLRGGNGEGASSY